MLVTVTEGEASVVLQHPCRHAPTESNAERYGR